MGSPGEAILTSPDPGQIVTAVPLGEEASWAGRGYFVTS